MTMLRVTDHVEREAAEDLFFGQVVIIWARWFMIAGAAGMSLWGAPDEAALAGSIALVVTLMVVNFFLHARHLAGQPANQAVVIGASLLDLLAVTLMIVSWTGEQGLESRYYVYYYPLVFAFALVFMPRQAGAYTILTLLLYGAACLAIDPSPPADAATLEPLVMRLITLAAMGGLGTFYWRIQRRRREDKGT